MYISVCKYCRKIFKTPIRTICCFDCRHLDKDFVDKIENYLKDHPNSNAVQVADALAVSIADILRYVDEGYLHSVEGIIMKNETKR